MGDHVVVMCSIEAVKALSPTIPTALTKDETLNFQRAQNMSFVLKY